MIVFLPSVASTAVATSLFASLMADGRIIVERFPLGSGVSLAWPDLYFLQGVYCLQYFLQALILQVINAL